MQTISPASYGILVYVKAIIVYCEALKEVKPKKERLRYLENELDTHLATLKNLKDELEKFETDLNALNQKYADTQVEQNKLNQNLQECERRLVSMSIYGLHQQLHRYIA